MQTKRKHFASKEMQSLRIFPVYNFFFVERSHVQTIEYFVYKNKDFPYAHILYRLSKVHFTYFHSIGNLRPREDFSTCYQKQGFSRCQFFRSHKPFKLQGKE